MFHALFIVVFKNRNYSISLTILLTNRPFFRMKGENIITDEMGGDPLKSKHDEVFRLLK